MPETPNFKLREPLAPPVVTEAAACAYAELDVVTNFSFLRGASHADELVFRATELGYRAIAITDIDSLAGVVRAHDAVRRAKEQGGRPPELIIGARLTLEDGPDLLVWAMDRAGYGRLCRLLTLGKRRTEKGQCALRLEDFIEYNEGLLAAVVAEGWSEKERGKKRKGKRWWEAITDGVGCASVHVGGGGTCAEAHPTTQNSGSGFRVPGLEGAQPGTRVPEPGTRIRMHLADSRIGVERALKILREAMGDRLSLASSCVYGEDDAGRISTLARLCRRSGVPLLATNNVHYHAPQRRMLQDILTCIRHGCTIHEAGFRLFQNGERYLKSPEQMRRLFAEFPEAIDRGLEIAERCNFNLDELKYEYPHEVVPEGQRPIEYLAELTWRGAGERYAGQVVSECRSVGVSECGNSVTPSLRHSDTVPAADFTPSGVRHQIKRELQLIEQLHFEPYFLTVYDLVKFARSRGILCQGRGSAANSAVCYCLGITSVDPAKVDLLFERFVSAARNEPPDIDVDFEHERREEVIQYLYEKYGRDRAGMTAEVITYRGRSAVRDVGKALGLSLDLVDQMAKKLDWWDRGSLPEERLRELGLDPEDPTVKLVVALTTELLGFPRHLSQHVGGMVMTCGPLCELVPIENASMENRTVIEWDKDDIDTLGILKVDALALGMLTCISKAFRLVNDEDGFTTESTENTEHTEKTNKGIASVPSVSSVGSVVRRPRRLELHTIPPEDPAVYDMLSDADSVGVFQVESRAQMSMLPRLRPRCFYDLVIEVAIVRPGPIQGNMVHPYLRRRNGEEAVDYPSEALRQVLHKTLGVPLFQEQAMRVAMVGAGFSGAEADRLRRAMAAWRRSGELDTFHQKIVEGMLNNGYKREFAEQCFLQIRGFGEYGFPESHAASFALLVYVSAWLKRYHPAAFCAALLNSQPMGFYAPAQIVRDAKEHGVEVRPADVNQSEWDCMLETAKASTNGYEWTRRNEATDEHRWTQMRDRSMGMLPMSVASGAAPKNRPQMNADERRSEQENLRSSAFICGSSIREHSCPFVDKKTWGANGPAVRLGFRQLKGLREVYANQIVEARKRVGRFQSIWQLHRATGLSRAVLERLAEADAFASLGLSRREALWHVMELDDAQLPLFDEVGCASAHVANAQTCAEAHPTARTSTSNPTGKSTCPCHPHQSSFIPHPSSFPPLPPMPLGQEVMTDYRTAGLSLKKHPVSLVRDRLEEMKIITAEQLNQLPHGRWVSVAGLVLIRQRPGTASGIVFETLEDETGIVNLIIRPNIYDKYRLAARHAGLLNAQGYVERQGQVIHVMVWRMNDLSDLLAGCQFTSRDFH